LLLRLSPTDLSLTLIRPPPCATLFPYTPLFRSELVRRQRGGTAVVMGALSPRARNAQVGMFQAGEVDYLVATDAIGMGLNMDLRSEEHTSELQSLRHLVCRLLLEKKKQEHGLTA